MDIEITHFRILDDIYIKAVASILIDQQLAVHDIRLLQHSPRRLMVAMPSRADSAGKRRDSVHPITAQLRQQIDDLLLGEYRRQRPNSVTLQQQAVHPIRQLEE